jgi:hypothetical protein
MDKLKYGDSEVEFEEIGLEHDIIRARFTGLPSLLYGRPLCGWGMSRREAAIDLLRAERDIRFASFH